MTTTAATDVFPHIDASQQDCLTEAQVQFFRDNGLLVIRNVIRGAELKAMQDETLPLVQQAVADIGKPTKREDYRYQNHELTGQEVPFRVEYVVDKTRAAKVLAGHPFILKSVEKIQGRNFIPTWDSMVFKNAGAGVAIPWHRDSGAGNGATEVPLFNVDFYLDGSDMTNCLWGILGSNRWSEEDAKATVTRLNDAPGKFSTDDQCAPILMNPGDVIFHNILALHGSPAAQSKLRRVVYYEYRPIEIELKYGPHKPEYIPLKQKIFLACLRDRANCGYAKGETPFTYQPSAQYAPPTLGAGETLETYRVPHEKFWRG
jgi:phytanoyl-CoA hydroxylase